MRKLNTLLMALLICIIAIPVHMLGQAPEKFSYQAIIRDEKGDLVTEGKVNFQISILQGLEDGAVLYIETHETVTNANGLANIEIGGGKILRGVFSNIDWSDGPYFLRTETDPKGGTDYQVTGTSQLLSVPYALYSKIGGMHVKKLHAEDELNLIRGSSSGPNVPGSSINIGDISSLKGLILEWRMQNRPEVFQQFVYLSQYDKDIILGNIPIPEPEDESDSQYPRRYTTILSDGFGNMMWLGVSLQGTQLYLSTNSMANPTPRLQRIYGIL